MGKGGEKKKQNGILPVRKRISKAVMKARREKRNKILVKRIRAAQKWSWVNFMPRTMLGREFKLHLSDRNDTSAADMYGHRMESNGLLVLAEITQSEILRVLGHVSATLQRAGKRQATAQGIIEAAHTLGVTDVIPELQTVLTARSAVHSTASRASN